MINIKQKAIDYASQLLQNKKHGLIKIIITKNEF